VSSFTASAAQISTADQEQPSNERDMDDELLSDEEGDEMLRMSDAMIKIIT
jgi:hypothetical protein